MPGRPKLAVWKFASCDGCQLSLLDCEDELLALTEKVTIANFLEASSTVLRGPYDLSLVEGSITTPHDAERIHRIRRLSKKLVAIGACATAGGIQALRNFGDVKAFAAAVYPSPQTLEVLGRSTAIAEHVPVDFELRGCPISKAQLLEVVTAILQDRRPVLPTYSVCEECKQRGVVCLAVARGVPCMGPVVQAGCGALCPAYDRGCFGCFGPCDAPNTKALANLWLAAGRTSPEVARAFQSFAAGAPAFVKEGLRHEVKSHA